MAEAPECIWIEDEFGEGDDDQWTYGTWDVRNYRGYDVEYVRADIVQALTAERDRLRDALIEERTETLWNAYNTGMERDGRWRHMCMSDGEWLERECGLAVIQPDHPADVVKAAIPFAAKRFVAAIVALKGESHE